MAIVAGPAIGLLGSVTSTEAQSPVPVSIEARLNGVIPTGALGERWRAGLGVGVTAAVQLLPNYALYAGYSHTSIGLNPFADSEAVDSGISAGLIRRFPGAGTGLMPWVKGGVLFHSLEIRENGGDRTEGDGRPGFEVGAGVMVPNPRIPALRGNLDVGYRRYSARVLGPNREPVTYFSAGVGLLVAF